jgi:hypothetical protein|nr:MAG TPA: ASCH domain protein [Caudoviricetes sp.]
MQKRMFRDRYGLTDLVLSGQKTQTRDVIKIQDERLDYLRGWNLDGGFAEFGRDGEEPLRLYPKYYVGEVVAVAQSYQKAYPNADFEMVKKWTFMTESAGWKNKMFVRPDLMPHAIKITKIRFERLQDISDEDCLAEGVEKDLAEGLALYWFPVHIEGISWEEWKARSYELSRHEYEGKPGEYFWGTPQEAYAALIDKIYGYGTWASNPYVWVYDFELVK